jgi:hypothetical protein
MARRFRRTRMRSDLSGVITPVPNRHPRIDIRTPKAEAVMNRVPSAS